MTKEQIINLIDHMISLENRQNDIQDKIASIKLGDITICTATEVLTPEDQARVLFQDFATTTKALEDCEELLGNLSVDELTTIYLALMSEDSSPLREARLNSLAKLMKEKEQKESMGGRIK